jgi:hypothetical protein
MRRALGLFVVLVLADLTARGIAAIVEAANDVAAINRGLWRRF